jgi:hypothetical protein
MIKPILPAIALIGASLLLPTAARADDYSGIDHYCYMVESSGRVINLSTMCSRTAPPPESDIDFGAYLERYEALADTGNFKYDPVADGLEYCTQASVLNRSEMTDWKIEQWSNAPSSLESDYLLDHWSVISVLAPDLLCPQL